jgi:hypothetical protein
LSREASNRLNCLVAPKGIGEMKIWNMPIKWERYQNVKYREILERWPQLSNWRFVAPSINHTDRVIFNTLVRIGRNISPEETIRCCDLIPLIVKFGVKDWPKEEQIKKALNWKSLTPQQRSKFRELAYWNDLNNKPLSPKRHAPISHAYTSTQKLKSKI